MKLLLSPTLWASVALAFPAALLSDLEANVTPEMMARAAEMLEGRAKTVKADDATKVFEPVPMFNKDEQFIDVGPGSGHEWQAPGKDDIRGPCPGLNAFANHGFLPRNGYATAVQFIDATTNVVGMGIQLATFLAALGGFLDGDGVAWSIGGTPSIAIAGPLGNMGNGISGSHNKYESDASPTRPDLYEAGNDYKTMNDQFNQLISMSPGGKVDLDSLTKFRSKRFDTQIANNKYFFNGPFTGVLVQPAAYTFIYRFMANHSEAEPYGLLSYDTIASWFGMYGKPGNYKAKQGYERIPDDWYKRANAYPYDNEYFLTDAANAALIYPKFLDVGGNTGKTNSFAGIDVSDLTGGVYNSQNLGKNKNFACLAYEFATQAKPDIASNVLGSLSSTLGQITSSLSCPKLQKIDDKQLKQFPGYTRSNVGY